MQYIPKETVTLWINRRDYLEPMKLIPALVQYDHKKYREQVCRKISSVDLVVVGRCGSSSGGKVWI
jgi:hypothetical protein